MLDDRKGREDSLAVCQSGKEILHYGAEPSMELESRESSPSSLGRRLVMKREGLCLEEGASRGVQGFSGCGEGRWVLEEQASKCQPGLQGDPCSPASVERAFWNYKEVVLGSEGQSLLRAECSSWQLRQHAAEDGQQLRTGSRLPPLGLEGLGQGCSALV